ncbi:MAG TPA: bifunctional phosphopantothenoylcysteine decarboxylase/phosphopantothenate--cysteine ligase CoaBC [Pseudogracilibacillus sp.]|nr:bifunctional phosphopantothenoylcysteine decarboxylase/phosphopantothenate--cysteine ligase CoaBC [Pseudogracilibacillus sp.]
MLEGKNIVLGVTGGIAVYKACDLTSKLVQKGADVRVMMTEGATKFVSPLTFQALSRNDVYVDTFEEKHPKKIAHVDVADWADIFIMAPASANTLGKLSHGIADNMLTTTLLATQAAVYIAPAMNVHMYQHPAVMENMKKLDNWGYHFIEPGAGYLACGYVGKGRMEEPLSIINVIEEHRKKVETNTWSGKTFLISAGPTREELDPVRFFSNRSTGKMGFALAEAAASQGAFVILVTGVVDLTTKHPNIKRVDVLSAEDMYQAMITHFDQADVVIKAAAVADYRPKQVHEDKMKKSDDGLKIEMERTRDILQTLGEQKKQQFLVGFAAETRDPVKYGKMKLTEKHLDAIVVNNVKEEGAGFGGETNAVTYLNTQAAEKTIPLASKDEVAATILEMIQQDIKEERS